MNTKETAKKVILTQKLGSYNYKIYIPYDVEQKIRYACQQSWNTEWSGVLFFTPEGSFENNDLVIRCKDIYIMDIGSSTYTEFDMSPDVISYMTENPELLDCQMGLIHSHDNMSTFFSGTDTATLREEGIDRNNFVSLIVNNAGTYTAAITRKVTSKHVKEQVSYEFFDQGTKSDTLEYDNNVEEIEWFNLIIEKEGKSVSLEGMENRFKEIRERKRTEVAKKSYDDYPLFSSTPSMATPKVTTSNIVPPKKTLNDGSAPLTINDLPTYDNLHFNKEKIKSLVLQIVTGSIILTNDSKIDVVRWASSMPSHYEKRFGKNSVGFQYFREWAKTYTEFLTWYVDDPELEKFGFDETEICAICARDLISELRGLPKNAYINVYIEELHKFMEI